MLRAGGTAADAAIAANVMLSLVEPMSCGPGGDVFALVWHAKTRTLHGLNGSGRAPGTLTLKALRSEGLTKMPETGPLSWTVPGCVDGWSVLHQRFGSSSWESLFEPTIHYAENGFSVTPVIAEMWRTSAPHLSTDPGSAKTFLRGGRAPASGEIFRNLKLARTLKQIAQDGSDAFYRGQIARGLVAFAQDIGAPLTSQDLGNHTSTWVEPVSLPFRGFDVWELPPNTQGIVVLEMLNILRSLDLKTLGHNSADYLHFWIEAKKLAYENRAMLIADMANAPPAWRSILSSEHGARQRLRIDPNCASCWYAPTMPEAGCDTVYVTAVDAQRNAVSLIQSIYGEFGSGNTPLELGFALQNRGSLFHLDPRHPNAFEPGKRPFHTIIPGMVTSGGDPVFSFGVMGGDMQPQGQVQILLNRLVFGMNAQATGEALRVRHDGSSTPTGDTMTDGGVVHLEPGFPPETVADLQARGHRVRLSSKGFGGYQGIWIDHETQRLIGGSEPRKDGCAMGY